MTKKPKMRLGRVVFGFFFAIIGVLGLVSNAAMPVYADPVEGNSTIESGENTNTGDANNQNEQRNDEPDKSSTTATTSGDGCKESLGAIGWLVCPATGAIAGAVDYLYGLIQNLLDINPVEMKDGSPIYEIWKYCRGLANIVFIIFLLVVIYSQLTGLGISNYGVKKALPKLIVVAVLVNLSFLICSLAVDVSNVVGNSLRGLFDSVEEAAVAGMQVSDADVKVTNADLFSTIAGGAALTIGGAVVAFETGAIWMLIPTVLGALVAVVTGLITIALRQAVVALLIMIAPLAVVAYMLPNTESLGTRWRKLLTQMLVFYPMFSLLFGAAALAGFAIVASATDGFGLLLGVAVQIFPLFFSWKLMQMSGTFLGTINTKMRELTSTPLAKNRAWADSHRMATKQRQLASERPITPSLRLMQFMSNRRVDREAETTENAELVKNRGLAYRARRNYDRNGAPNRRAEESYANQARTMEYQRIIERDKNNMNRGLGQLAASRDLGAATRARLDALDMRNVVASDTLKFEQARGEKITADNAEGFYKRAEAAMNWHMDRENSEYLKDENGEFVLRDGDRVLVPKAGYKTHFDGAKPSEVTAAATRYNTMKEVMEGNVADVHFAAADAAYSYDTQRKVIESRYQKYFELNPPTKDVLLRLKELSTYHVKDENGNFKAKAVDNIDAIVSGLRVLNQRGDTDLVRKVWGDLKNEEYGGIELGTHASQAIASFLMFDVGKNDPWLRREGKYINLETAQVYNENKRKEMRLDMNEYAKGYYLKRDADGNKLPDLPENRIASKRSAPILLLGTDFDSIERTAMDNITDGLMEAYGYEAADDSGRPKRAWDVNGWIKKNEEIRSAIGPQFISASLKYLSGSEQISSAVKFLTGYTGGEEEYQDENGVTQRRKKTVWNSGKFSGHEKEVQQLYRGQVMKWLKDQTGGQILNMRSDYRDAVWDHLFEAYFDENPDDLYGKVTTRQEYEEMRAEIQTRYGGLAPAEAKARRDSDLRDLKSSFAEVELRKNLGESGVLDRILKLSRTSASSGTKSWMNTALSVEDEQRLKAEIEFYKKKRQQKHNTNRRNNDDQRQEDGNAGRIYNETDVANNLVSLTRFRNEHNDGTSSVGDVYVGLIGLVRECLGENTFIEEEFARQFGERNNPGAVRDDVEKSELYRFMEEHFGDLRWY